MNKTDLHAHLLERFATAEELADAFTRIVTGSGLYQKLKGMPLDEAVHYAVDWCEVYGHLDRLEAFVNTPPKQKPEPIPPPQLAWEGKYYRVILHADRAWPTVEYRAEDSLGAPKWSATTKKRMLQWAIAEMARAWLAAKESDKT